MGMFDKILICKLELNKANFLKSNVKDHEWINDSQT